MHQSKLFTLLRGLEPADFHWLQKFISSPFYNTNPLHNDLFNFIKKYYPDLDSKKLSKEATCKKFFPDEPFNIQKLRKAMHGLTTLTEEFLVAMRLRNNSFEKKKILVAELGERNIYGAFEKGTKELISELEALLYRDTFFYKNMHELQMGYFGHVATKKEKKTMPIVVSATEQLDFYYLLQRQQLDCSIKGQEKIFGDDLKINSLKESKTNLQNEPVFNLYNLVYKALSVSDNEAIYLKIENLYKKEIKKLSRTTQLELIRFLLNYLSSQINKGREGFALKTLSLYKFGLEKKLIIEKGRIGEYIFGNIATVGILAEEYDWVIDFITKYSGFLKEDIKEEVKCLSLGLLYFHKKDFDETIKLLLHKIFSNSLYMLNSKTILLRTYMEMFLLNNDYYELVLAQTHAFEKYVRRYASIANSKKQMFLNFILFTRKLINATLQKNVDKNLYEAIVSTEPMVLKSWLLSKIKIK